MSASPFSVRPLANAAEADAFFRLAAATFVRDTPAGVAGPDWRRFAGGAEGAGAAEACGAFRGGVLAGGYLIEERVLRVGPARLRIGCVGAVVTDPRHRRRGVATALMRDARAVAAGRRLGLLLLNGLADFYDPFGYVDVFDATEHAIERTLVLSQPPGPYRLRPATSADAPALLDLYRRHWGPYPGSFDRTPARQARDLAFAASLDPAVYRQPDRLPFALPLLAVDPADRPRGYLVAPWGPLAAFGYEAADDDWPAALALLQHHAGRLDALPAPPDDLVWPLPPDSPTFFLLVDHLPVRSRSRHHPRAGWMASPVDLPDLVPALSFRPGGNAGAARPRLGSATCASPSATRHGALRLAPGEIHLLAAPPAAPTVRLRPAALAQLLFGYRPAAWVAAHPDDSVPPDLLPVLDVLFPAGQAWIPPTDGC